MCLRGARTAGALKSGSRGYRCRGASTTCTRAAASAWLRQRWRASTLTLTLALTLALTLTLPLSLTLTLTPNPSPSPDQVESIGSLMRAEEVSTDEKIKWLCAAPAAPSIAQPTHRRRPVYRPVATHTIAQWQPSSHAVGCDSTPAHTPSPSYL